MKKLILIIISLIIIGGNAEAQFKLSGKIRTLRPLLVSISDLNGNIILQKNITSGVEFASDPLEITEDYYIIKMGALEKRVLLENKPVYIKGFLDDKNEANSTLIFDGLPLNESMELAMNEFKQFGKKGWDWNIIKDRYPVIVLSSIIYDTRNYFSTRYEAVADVVSKIQEGEDHPLVIQKLKEMRQKMEHFSLGSKLINFNLPDKDGKLFSTADFSGKFILLDFWASWCGPCRAEMKSLHKIYEEIRGDDLIFISISLDDDRTKWIKAMEADNIPWLALWDEDGFEKTKFKEQFGFSAIPFIVLVGKDGRLFARNLRGENVKNEIEKQRKNN